MTISCINHSFLIAALTLTVCDVGCKKKKKSASRWRRRILVDIVVSDSLSTSVVLYLQGSAGSVFMDFTPSAAAFSTTDSKCK